MLGETLGRFGDRRLACVGGALLGAMQRHRTLCIHRLARDRNQAIQFGRFLDNRAVTTQEMPTEADRPTRRRARCSGDRGHDGTAFRHACRQQARLRQEPAPAKAAVSDRRGRAADEKESRRWLDGAEAAGDVLSEAATITVVADRKSDIYALFARRPTQVHLLCRSAQDRLLAENVLLSACCDGWAEQDRYTITLPACPGRPERRATVALRFGAVTLQRPRQAVARDLPKTVALWAVDVRELNAPKGQEPVHWPLLTTHQIGTVEQARQIVAWYRLCWIIEQVFRSLKTHGLRIEESQMIEARSFTKLAVVAPGSSPGAGY
jgi:hypothetical protein